MVLGLTGASLIVQLVKNLPAMQETPVQFLGWKDPLLKGKIYLLKYSGLENSMDCIVHAVTKSWKGLSGLLFGGFSGSSVSKESACNAGDGGLIPGSGRSPGEGNGNSLQYSCLGNTMERGAWWAAVHGVAKSQTRLSN